MIVLNSLYYIFSNKFIFQIDLFMIKFIKHITFFLLPIILLSLIVELCLRNIPNNYSYKNKYLDENSNSIKILFLGSSHAYFGINPTYIPAISFNAAYTSQSLDLDLAILLKYKDKWNDLKFIVIPVDYFSLYDRLETTKESWRIKNYNIYYHIHTSCKIQDNSETFGNKFKFNLWRLNEFYYKGSSDFNCTNLGFGTDYNSKCNLDLILTGRSAAARHKAKNDFWVAKNIEVLKTIIRFAKEKNINLILYTSPAYKTYVRHLDTLQLNNTINVINGLTLSSSNVSYYNLLNNPSFTKIDFYDADHLNEIGAKKMTFILDSVIKQISEKGLSTDK